MAESLAKRPRPPAGPPPNVLLLQDRLRQQLGAASVTVGPTTSRASPQQLAADDAPDVHEELGGYTDGHEVQEELDSGTDALVAEAERRLREYKIAWSTAKIKRLQQEHGLDDGAALGLRMLAPPLLAELLADEEDLAWKLAEVPDKSKLMLSLIQQLDPEVEDLVSRLLEIDSGAGATEEQPSWSAGPAPPPQAAPDVDPVAEAEQRLGVKKSAREKAAIQRLSQRLGLSDEALLSLKLLAPKDLGELLAGAADVDSEELLVWWIKELDPRAVELVRGLQAIDQGAAPEPPPEQAWSSAELVGEATRRMSMNRSDASKQTIARLMRQYALREEVELALKMLPTRLIEDLHAAEGDLQVKFSTVADKSVFMMSLIKKMDPAVEALVRALVEADGGGGVPAARGSVGKSGVAAAKASAPAPERSRSPLRAGPGRPSGVNAPFRPKSSQPRQPQPPSYPPEWE